MNALAGSRVDGFSGWFNETPSLMVHHIMLVETIHIFFFCSLSYFAVDEEEERSYLSGPQSRKEPHPILSRTTVFLLDARVMLKT